MRSLAGSPRRGQGDAHPENKASVHLAGQALGVPILGGAGGEHGGRGESPGTEKGGQGQSDTTEGRDQNGLNSDGVDDMDNIY